MENLLAAYQDTYSNMRGTDEQLRIQKYYR
jgi:hypothetical protein